MAEILRPSLDHRDAIGQIQPSHGGPEPGGPAGLPVEQRAGDGRPGQRQDQAGDSRPAPQVQEPPGRDRFGPRLGVPDVVLDRPRPEQSDALRVLEDGPQRVRDHEGRITT